MIAYYENSLRSFILKKHKTIINDQRIISIMCSISILNINTNFDGIILFEMMKYHSHKIFPSNV